MAKFMPQTILISGATGGIGSALAKQYASAQTTLILTGRDAKRLSEIAEACQQKGAKVVTHTMDVTDASVLSAWLEQLLSTYTIDLVIANAGISAGINQHGQLECLQTTTHVLNVNLLAVINMIYPIMQQMQKRKTGQIALMSSLASYRGLPHSPVYCASKAAIRVYGESLRGLLKSDNVYLTVICPGFVQSAMSDKVRGPKPYLMSAEHAARIIQEGLQKKRSEIVFPKRLKFTLNLLSLLPKHWSDYLLVKIKSYVAET